MASNIKLGVNIDHVATLRQARGTQYPSIVQVLLFTCGRIDDIFKMQMFMRFAHCYKQK